MMKICECCLDINLGPYLRRCAVCYKGKKTDPNFVRKKRVFKKDLIGTSCIRCGKIRKSIKDIESKFCSYCYSNNLREINPAFHERQKKLCRDARRRERGIDTELPLLNAPSGSGSIKKGQGYRVICKKEFRGMPHADKKGRIAEHTYVMMNHLKRPLHKGETVHHINGIRHDNRIENLELWSSSHPPGQRIEDKIKWCKEFLKVYGYDIIKS